MHSTTMGVYTYTHLLETTSLPPSPSHPPPQSSIISGQVPSHLPPCGVNSLLLLCRLYASYRPAPPHQVSFPSPSLSIHSPLLLLCFDPNLPLPPQPLHPQLYYLTFPFPADALLPPFPPPTYSYKYLFLYMNHSLPSLPPSRSSPLLTSLSASPPTNPFASPSPPHLPPPPPPMLDILLRRHYHSRRRLLLSCLQPGRRWVPQGWAGVLVAFVIWLRCCEGRAEWGCRHLPGYKGRKTDREGKP